MCSFLVGLLSLDCLVGIYMLTPMTGFREAYPCFLTSLCGRSIKVSQCHDLQEGLTEQGILKEPDFPLHKAAKGQPTIKVMPRSCPT